MNIARAYQAYQVNQVNTVSGKAGYYALRWALKFITQAINGIEERNLEKKYQLYKSSKIIAELMGNLNRDVRRNCR